MGWIFTYKAPGQSIEDFFKHRFDCVNEHGSRKILATSARLNVAYMAVELIPKGKEREVFGLVCIIKRAPSDPSYNFGYKDVDESDGPFHTECPAKILDLLTPTDNEYALEWRKRCRENIEKAEKAKQIKVGDVVEFEAPICFLNGDRVKRLRCFSKKPLVFTTEHETYIRYKVSGQVLRQIPYQICRV